MTTTMELSDGLAVLTLARPAASNALDRALKAGLLDALRSLAADESVRAVLLRAEGRNFCVGQDLAEHVTALDADPATAMATVREHYNPLITALAAIQVPVVVAINEFVIKREERYLTRRFGDEYTSYTTRVRRWL